MERSRSILPNIYKFIFLPKAKKRFDRLDASIRRQLARKLEERCRNPRVQPDAMRDMPDCYKIKLRSRGIRLVYQVRDNQLILLVVGIGGREKEDAYRLAASELAKLNG